MTGNGRINPFTPRDAVQPEYFFGRQKEMSQIQTALKGALHGKTHRILVRGDRGLGKTSIVLYAASMASFYSLIEDEEDVSFAVVKVRLGGCRNLDEVCSRILRAFHKICPNGLKETLSDILKRISGVTVGPVGIELSSKTSNDILVPNFDALLEEIIDKILAHGYSGILLTVDETESFSRMQGAADFTKNFLERLNDDGITRIVTLLTATPEGVDALTKDHPSFPRLFSSVDLQPLSKDETIALVTKTLEKGYPVLNINEDVLQRIYRFSNGYPYFIQEMGYWCFQADTDGHIRWRDFVDGVLGTPDLKGALDTVGDNIFGKKVLRDLKSEDHRKILGAIAEEKRDIVTIELIRSKITGKTNSQTGALVRSLCNNELLKKIPGEKNKYSLPSRMFKLWLSWTGVGEEPSSQ